MKNKRRAFTAAAILAVIGAWLAYSALADRTTPTGQPPLVEVNDQVLEEFRNTFNRAEGQVRVIALLSPT